MFQLLKISVHVTLDSTVGPSENINLYS